jgi:hypothetical protein
VHSHLIALLRGEVALSLLEDLLDYTPIRLLGGGSSSSNQQVGREGEGLRAEDWVILQQLALQIGI